MGNRYYMVVMKYTTDSNDPCDPPPHIADRIAMAVGVMHQEGYALDVIYGKGDGAHFDKLEKEMNGNE